MTTTIDFPDLDAAIDAESWQWLQDAALYAVRRQLGDLRQCAEALGVGL